MRFAVVVVSLVSLAIPASAQIAAPDARPATWEQTMIMQSPQAMTTKSFFCTDPTVEAKGSPGPGRAGTKLRRAEDHALGREHAFDSTCRIGGRVTHTKGTATGDFQSNYQLNMVSDAGGTQSKMQIDSKWLGPCPAAKKPGDMTMPGRMTINILTMTGRAPPKR